MPWVTITNAQLAVGAPIRSVDLLALRDNISAVANGDTGAPRIQTLAIADNAVTAAKVNKGNGIGTSGTQLVVACPAFNTVGSYCFSGHGGDSTSKTAGTNYAAGGGVGQIQPATLYLNPGIGQFVVVNDGAVSGTWKWMGASVSNVPNATAICCRVS